MGVHLRSALLFFLGRCSAINSEDWNPSFMADLSMPNQSMTLKDYDEIERDLYPHHRFKREGNFCLIYLFTPSLCLDRIKSIVEQHCPQSCHWVK